MEGRNLSKQPAGRVDQAESPLCAVGGLMELARVARGVFFWSSEHLPAATGSERARLIARKGAADTQINQQKSRGF